MSPRALTPWGWLAAAVAGLVLIAVVAAAWDRLWSWLPWSAEARADRAEASAERSADAAEAAGLTVEGQAETIRRLDTYHHQVVTVRAVAAEAAAAARSAPDATDSLDPDRADRLRAADRELCRVAPALDGCAAPPDAP